MANVQPNNLSSGNVQDFHDDGSVKISPDDTIQTLNIQNGYSDDGRLRISSDLMLFNDTIEGTTLNTNLWATATNVMTVTQSNGSILLNAGSSVAAATYAILSSNKQFLKMVGNTLFFQGIISWLPTTQSVTVAGAVYEFGLANFSGTTLPVSDGIFIRTTAAGDTYLVQAFNSQEESTEVLLASNGKMFVPVSGHFYLFEILITDEHVHIELVDLGTTTEEPGTVNLVNMTVPLISLRPAAFSVSHLPLSARVFNQVTTLTAPQFFLGGLEVSQLDLAGATRQWGEMLTVNQKGAYQGPNTVAGLTQTANHANSTSPVSAALSNTAAGYTTLGGRYQFAAPAGAATDYALFAYQVPTGVDLIITGLRISSVNTGAAVATTATILDWSIAVNSSAVSLATAEAPPTSWSPRRIPVGLQSFLVGAAIGASPGDEVVQFNTPIVCNGGRFVHIILQVPVGTATASQVIRGDVLINGYFE